MFEQYSVPSLTYCVDALMSFYYKYDQPQTPFVTDGLVISFNTASTSVIPVLRGKGILSQAKRYVGVQASLPRQLMVGRVYLDAEFHGGPCNAQNISSNSSS